jgi:DNA-directed RNA polymerase subunit beta
MQSLALNVGVVSEEGEQAELGDEDDDLLRAAEELGIDLSGVRAPANGADERLDSEDDSLEGSAGGDGQPDEAGESIEEVLVEEAEGIGLEDLDGEPLEEPDLQAAPDQET